MEVWDNFLKGHKEDIVTNLETRAYEKGDVKDMLSELRVLRRFADVGRMFIEQGKSAERKLREDEAQQ